MVIRQQIVLLSQVILCGLFWLAGPVIADHSVHLTTSEKTFISQHPEIILGTERSWEPYVIVNSDGSISGYDIEILNRINKLTGANFQLQAGDWLDMQEKAKSRQIDGLSTGGAYKEREQYFLFSKPYLSLSKMLLVLKSNPKNIHIKSDLKGKTIVIHKGNLADEKLAEKYSQSVIIKVDTIKEMIEAVIMGRADATFGNGSTLYMAQKLQMPYLQPAFILEDHLELVFAVRKDWPEAVSILNKGLLAIGDSARMRLLNKWMQSSPLASVEPVKLTAEESHYLDNKAFIAMCTDPDWMPYEQITKEGEHRGILGDYHRLWAKKIGKEIRLVKTESWTQSLQYMKQRRCDILSSAQATVERRHYMDFTSPFVSYPIAVATRNDELFFERFEQILGYELAVVKGYSTIETLKKKYPEIHIVEVDSPLQGLTQVSKGDVFAYIDTVPTIGYQTQTHGILNIKISGVLDEKYNMSVGVRNDEPLLLDIFNKAVASISNQERYAILNKWISIKYEKVADYSFFWKLIGGIIFLLLLVIYRERVISRYNHKLKLMNQELARISKIDPLTGVANRYSLADFFRQEVARKKRYHSNFSVIMVDLDHFKQVNDDFGHNVGDKVLQTVAKILSDHVRANDVVGRWGGEEFIILCPQSNHSGILRLAESLRQTIAVSDFPDVGQITASFGVTVYGEDESLETFIKRVDDALYEAKDRGRNCVHFH